MQAGTGAVKQAHTGGLEFLFWRKESFADCESSQKKGDKNGDKMVIRRVIRKPGAGDALVSTSVSIRRMEDYDENYQGERL